MSKQFCVIGDPISHSKSPAIYNAMMEKLGLNWSYHCEKVPAADCLRFLSEVLESGRLAGFNATMPHKETLAGSMRKVAPLARRAGSVNTVVIKNSQAVGHSTDGIGLCRALDSLGALWRGETVCLLGAGGAALAGAVALADGGAERLIVCSRTREKANILAARAGGVVELCGFSQEELTAAAGQAALVVNCTNLGMGGTGAGFASLDFLRAMKDGAAVYDMVYQPRETALFLEAKAQGLLCATGLSMLVQQAIAAMELYVGHKLDRKGMEQAILPMLS
jgi:Shikimate 5-dehydrogenase